MRLLETLWYDVRFGGRLLARSPVFATIAALTLALGIGATTAIFSVANAILLRPIPFKEPSRLVAVLDRRGAQGVDWLYVSPSRFDEWVRRNDVFEQMAALHNCYWRGTPEAGGATALIPGACASPSFFPILGVQPILGRLFAADEDQPGRNRVVLLSYRFWKQRFSA